METMIFLLASYARHVDNRLKLALPEVRGSYVSLQESSCDHVCQRSLSVKLVIIHANSFILLSSYLYWAKNSVGMKMDDHYAIFSGQ